MDWTLIDFSSLGAGLTLATICGFRRITGTGKYITGPMMMVFAFLLMRWKHRQVKKIVKKRGYGGSFHFHYHVTGEAIRIFQIIGLFAFATWRWSLDLGGLHLPAWTDFTFFWLPYVALYADDIISNIDKDKWKKRFKALKNKLKWRWTPAPVPVQVR